jgi:hypothetical protein
LQGLLTSRLDRGSGLENAGAATGQVMIGRPDAADMLMIVGIRLKANAIALWGLWRRASFGHSQAHTSSLGERVVPGTCAREQPRYAT